MQLNVAVAWVCQVAGCPNIQHAHATPTFTTAPATKKFIDENPDLWNEDIGELDI